METRAEHISAVVGATRKEPEANSRHGMMENVLSFRPSFVAVLQFDAIRKTDSHEHLVNI
jgi:hypothetical protein